MTWSAKASAAWRWHPPDLRCRWAAPSAPVPDGAGAQFRMPSVYGVLALFCAVPLFFTWLWLYEPLQALVQ